MPSMKTERNLNEVGPVYENTIATIADHSVIFLVNRLHCKGTTFDADMVLGMFQMVWDRPF